MNMVGGWYATPLKNMKLSWDDEIPNRKINIFQTTNQMETMGVFLPSVDL